MGDGIRGIRRRRLNRDAEVGISVKYSPTSITCIIMYVARGLALNQSQKYAVAGGSS
jgi:hypothetical protein